MLDSARTDTSGVTNLRNKPRGDATRTCHLQARVAAAPCHEAALALLGRQKGQTSSREPVQFNRNWPVLGQDNTPWSLKITQPAGSAPFTNQHDSQAWDGCIRGRCHQEALPSSLDVPSTQENSPQWHHSEA